MSSPRFHCCALAVALVLTLAGCDSRRNRISVDAGDVDANVVVDSGADAAGAVDSGAPIDSGPLDSGALDLGIRVDAGPSEVTTCSVGVAPLAGLETADFTFTAASNGTGCSARVDGGPSLVLPCNGMLTYPGSMFGVGIHTVDFLVGAGPSGPTECGASFTVAASSVTTCSVIVTPPVGTTTTTFVADFDSNGTSCTADVDGLSVGVVDCLGSFSGMGSLLGVGTHTGRLNVVDGPGGPTSCTDTFSVTAP